MKTQDSDNQAARTVVANSVEVLLGHEGGVMHENRIEALQAMPIFGGIRKDILEFLLSASEVLSVPKDKYFFREKDQAEAIYVLAFWRPVK